MTDPDATFLDQQIALHGSGRSATIPLLQALQERYGYLPTEAMERICERTEITRADLTGVATFYTQFRLTPAGRDRIRVCVGTACHVKGAERVHDAFREHLAIPEGQDTDADRRFTVEKVACLGCCMLAPAVQIGEAIYGHVGPERVGEVIDDFLAGAGQASASALPEATGEPAGEIRISMDTCCVASGARHVARALADAVRRTNAPAVLKPVGCWGKTYLEPIVEVRPVEGDPVTYQQVRPDEAEDIVRRHFPARGLLRRARTAVRAGLERLLTDEAWAEPAGGALRPHHPSLKQFDERQVRIATEYCGQARPTDLDEYERHDGFVALRRCLEYGEPEWMLSEVRAAGLRGRGGAGYPTADKWLAVRDAPGRDKYVVCNGDEGDPGAFMDRMLLEAQPYRVIEGALLAAYAVGAHTGYVYIRAEYPLAVERMNEAVARCRERNLLGADILGSGFSFEFRVMEAAGAFVCGEETALLASIEGRRGMPRLRPPYPSRQGLWGYPTLINNIETCSVLPWIFRNGAEAFAAHGTDGSRGTKVFALAGKVVRGGLIEVPMGTTLREIVEDIGGGVAGGGELKAVQVGGPSGGCVPASMADITVDYEALARAGAMMGSGGMVVLDETDCMVDIARYFLEFTQDQSCGKCTPCRVGTRRMLEVLTRLCEGEGREGDIERLERIAGVVAGSSLCGLGRTAPNPVLSTIEHFRDEYEAHERCRCPAAKCRALIRYEITEDCIGCTRCAQHCPADAIAPRPHERHEIDQDKCVRCGTCRSVCPADAVTVE